VPTTEPAIRRALEGLTDRTGRTLVVVGAPETGKTAVLAELRAGVEAAYGRVVTIAGTYRGRSVPYGALEGLGRSSSDEDGEGGPADEPPEVAGIAPMAPVAIAPESIGRSRRREGRVRTTFLGEATRTRGPPARDPDEYWESLLPEFRGEDAHPVALLVEEAALFDTESRAFVLDLSRRARLRPFLIALALDSSSSAAAVWEEALLGRTDVDWVRLGASTPDPREVARLSELLTGLAAPAARLLGYVTLLGGETTAVTLARIAHLSLTQLRETARPAVAVGLLRLREDRVAVPDSASVPILEGLFPESDRQRWHRDVADGLHALSAEPPLSRRIEIAHHYLASAPDAVAMARLLEAAEISLGLLEYDRATQLLAEAIACLGSLPPAERLGIEPEMHLMNARALFGSGCPVEGEAELREGVDGALRAGTSSADLASWLEPLLASLQAVGPRPGVATTLVELAERLHDADLIEPEVLLEMLLPAYDVERHLPERSHAEALRAAQNAHRLRERHLQALGLFAMGVARVTGHGAELHQAERFLRASRYLLRDSRRWELDYIAGEFECRVLELEGRFEQALTLRRQSVAALERARLPSVELFHRVGIARILLNRGDLALAEEPLARAARVADHMHLFPPAPGLLELWLLQGRRDAAAGTVEGAREHFSAIVDLPGTLSLPRFRAEATLRLALLEQSVGRTEPAQVLVERLRAPELLDLLPPPVREWPGDLAAQAPASLHGGGAFPGTSLPRGGPVESKRREQRGR